jgi:branched-chain amino acid transport system ATP-binding protein
LRAFPPSSEGTAVVIVEQDVLQAVAASSHAYCMREGRISLEGPSSALSQDAIKSAYFGI